MFFFRLFGFYIDESFEDGLMDGRVEMIPEDQHTERRGIDCRGCRFLNKV